MNSPAVNSEYSSVRLRYENALLFLPSDSTVGWKMFFTEDVSEIQTTRKLMYVLQSLGGIFDLLFQRCTPKNYKKEKGVKEKTLTHHELL